MTYRDHPYRTFIVLAIVPFILATLGSDVVARSGVYGESIGTAISEHLHYAAIQPMGTAMLLAPFLVLAWMAASLAKRKNFDSGLGVFLLGAVLLGFTYFSGFQDSQHYMKQRMWTAASLSVGLLPLKSIPVLVICLVVRWLVARRRHEAKA